MVALQTLRSINASLDQTNNRVSTGLRVASASDNAAYWSIATTLKSDNSALGAVQDFAGRRQVGRRHRIDWPRYRPHGTSADQGQAGSASQPGVDRAKLQTEISALISQIRGAADSTVTGGVNWLSVDFSDPGYAANKSFVASYARTGDAVTVTSIQIDSSTIKLFDSNVDLHTADRRCRRHRTGHVQRRRGHRVRRHWSTARSDADSDYTDAIQTADDDFETDGDAGARDVAYATALAAKNLAYSDAQTAFDDNVADLKDTLVTNLNDASVDGDGNPLALGLIDKARVAVSSVNGAAYVGSVADIDIGNLTDSDYDLAKIGNMLQIVDDALLDMTDASTVLGAAGARLDSQMTFVKALMDANTSAVGSLVDANMEEESTKLKALQTQQQLAVQSLSIANSSSQNILLLFRQ